MHIHRQSLSSWPPAATTPLSLLSNAPSVVISVLAVEYQLLRYRCKCQNPGMTSSSWGSDSNVVERKRSGEGRPPPPPGLTPARDVLLAWALFRVDRRFGHRRLGRCLYQPVMRSFHGQVRRPKRRNTSSASARIATRASRSGGADGILLGLNSRHRRGRPAPTVAWRSDAVASLLLHPHAASFAGGGR
jgi:hypothetical protein